METPPSTQKNMDRFSSHGTFGNNAQASTSHAEHANMMWGMWKKTADWQDRLHKRAAYKSLNIPEDDVITSTNITHSGIGWKELAIIALGGAVGLMGYSAITGSSEVPEAKQIEDEYDPLKIRVRITPQDGGGYLKEIVPIDGK